MVTATEILQKIISRAVGCTEVGAIALAVAVARDATDGKVERVRVLMDGNTLKNVTAVAVPGTGGKTGAYLAAAMGALFGHSDAGLRVLELNEKMDTAFAGQMIKDKKIEVGVAAHRHPVFIDATVQTAKGEGRAVIKGAHSNIVLITVDGEVISGDETTLTKTDVVDCLEENELLSMSVTQIVELTKALKTQDKNFLIQTVDTNLSLSEEGLRLRSGLGVGAGFQNLLDAGKICDDLTIRAKILTAAAVDARMAGSLLPAATNAGSGDQGLITVLPIAAMMQRKNIPIDDVASGLALAHLFAAYSRLKIGRLSTICSSAVAGTIGAATGCLYLMNPNDGIANYVPKIARAVVASLGGILCEGACGTCAMKLAAAAGVAVETAMLIANGMDVPADSGIAGETLEQTLDNFSLVSASMLKTESVILDTILRRTPAGA